MKEEGVDVIRNLTRIRTVSYKDYIEPPSNLTLSKTIVVFVKFVFEKAWTKVEIMVSFTVF